MNAYQQNAQTGKSYHNGSGQGSSGTDPALSTNYYLQKVGQHARATSDGAVNQHLQLNQSKDLPDQNIDRQYQQNDRKAQQSKDGAGAAAQQQQAKERKYSIQLSLQDPAAMRGSGHQTQQNQKLNLTQLDYSSSQYNYGAHSFGSSTTKNEQHKHQQGIDFGVGGGSSGAHGQTQELFLRSIPKKMEGTGRHQSAPRSGRGDEAGAAGNAQAMAREHHDAQQTKAQEYAKHQQVNAGGSGSNRGHFPSNSAEMGAASSTAAPQQPNHARKLSQHAASSQQQYQKVENSRQQYQGHHQVAQSQHLQHRTDWIDKDGRGMVYQRATAADEGRSAEIELKKGGSKSQTGTAGLVGGSSKRGGTAGGSQQLKAAGADTSAAGDGSSGAEAATGQGEGMQTKQVARVNGNTFKNYNGKKIISIQNSYQKAEFQKNQHNSSSNSGMQSVKSGSAANHSRKRSEKDPAKQQAPLPTTSYQKVHLRADKNAEHQGQPQAANDQEEAELQQTQHQADSGASQTTGAQSLVCQVPQNQAASLQQMQRMLLLQQQQQAAAQMYGDQEWLIGPQAKKDIGRKTLVLDLDETLVHSQFKPVEGADIVLPVEIEGQIWEIYILVRPGVSEFLHRMAKHYELVVFTASLSKYAEPLVAQLDPDGLCQYKLFREHCTQFNNAFVKDLTRLGRPMTDVIIVDNSPIAYLWQPENAIPCTSWYDDMSDTELDRIATILEKLAYEDDVRRIIRKIIKNNQIDDRAEQIYLKSHKRDHSQRPTADSRRVVDHGEATGIQIMVGQPGLRANGAAAKQVDGHQQQQLAGVQQQSQREKAEQRVSGGHHQRYESADNKQKYQGLVNEKIRRKNEVADQFSMNDAANYEQVLKMMHESGQVAKQKNPPGTANEGSSRKNGRRIQDPIVQVNKDRSSAQGKLDVKMAATRGSASNAVHMYGHLGQQHADHQRMAQYQDRDGNFTQKRSLDVHGSTQISSRVPHARHGSGAPAPLMADKKMQEMYQQQHLQLNYHPQTTKGNSSQTQQFSFDNQGQKMRIRERQGSQHIAGVNTSSGSHPSQAQTTPASKRAASVKNQNDAQILREQQQILAAQQAQLNKAQQQAQNRSRVYSAGNGAQQPSQAAVKGKASSSGTRGGAHGQAANSSTVGGPAIRSSMNGHPPMQASVASGNHHRKKSQAMDGQGGHHGAGQSAANQKLQKSHSQNRQSSTQRPPGDVTGHAGAQRAQSSGNRPGLVGSNGIRGSKEASGYSQHAQRAQQIHNYFSENVAPQPQGAHAFVSKNGQIQFDKGAEYAVQRGTRSSQGPSGNNSQKTFKSSLKDGSKMMIDGGHVRVGNDIGVKIGLQTAHINPMHHGVIAGQAVSSTKAAKKQGLMDAAIGQQYPSSTSGGHQLAAQYSHRGEAMGFLNKLSQQNMQSNHGQMDRRDTDGGQPSSNRALQAMYLAGGIGAHGSHGVQVSLNSPKYGQPLNFMGHGSGNNPSSPVGGSTGDSYIFQSDSSNSQFNRTGPIILNKNMSSSFADAHFYHQLGAGGPISTKNSNMSHASKAMHVGKDQLLKTTGHGRSTRGTASSQNPYHTQVISAHNQLVSASMNLDSQGQPQRTLQSTEGQPGGYKLKLSKKQKSTTIEPQNPVMGQNPPKTAPSSGYSAIQLNRQMEGGGYSQKHQSQAAVKYLHQHRSGQQQNHGNSNK